MTDENKSTLYLIDRHHRDPKFHSVVDLLLAYMMEHKIAPDEIRDAAYLASIKFYQLAPIKRFVYERDDLNWPPV